MGWGEIRAVIAQSYFHLLAIFTLVVFLLKIDVLTQWQFNFLLFALVLGLFGITLHAKTRVQLPLLLLYAALVAAVLVRVIPYLHSDVPLGYDSGIYKFAFEHPFGEQWLLSVFPLPFLLVMYAITAIFGWWFSLVPLFILLSALTGLVLFFVLQRLFDRNTAIIGACLFAVSIAQFETYSYLYYKNVVGILLLLWVFLYIEDNKRLNWKLIILGGLIAGAHNPAFFIFGIVYFIYVMIDLPCWRTAGFRYALANGALIVALAFLLNFDRIGPYLLSQVFATATEMVELSGGPGTFLGAKEYFLLTIPFIPFAITGFLHAWRKHLPLTIAGVLCAVMVVFRLFFYNRFIIYLDVFVLAFAAVGVMVLLRSSKMYGRIVVGAFFALAFVLVALHANATQQLLSSQEFHEIRQIDAVIEPSASIIVTDRYYSPWIKGWVPRPVIAPGLFDENKDDKSSWEKFLFSNDKTSFINRYQGPIYIHHGVVQMQYFSNESCMRRIDLGSTKLYQYACS